MPDSPSPVSRYDPERRYRPRELGAIASVQTLARWRSEKVGPDYVKVGGRVEYEGAAINDWLQSRIVNTNSKHDDGE